MYTLKNCLTGAHKTLIEYISLRYINQLILVPYQEDKDELLGNMFIEGLIVPNLRIVVSPPEQIYSYIRGHRVPYILVDSHPELTMVVEKSPTDAILAFKHISNGSNQ